MGTASHAFAVSRRRFGRLAQQLPPWILAPGLRRRTSYEVTLDGAAFEARRFAGIPCDAAVDLVLPASICLARFLSVPHAALTRIDVVVDLQMRQTLPNQGRDMVWRVCSSVMTGKQTRIEVYVLKRATLSALAAGIEARGIKLRTVRVAGASELMQFVDNRRVCDRWVRAWVLLSVLVASAAIGAAAVGIGGELRDLRNRVDGLLAERSRLADQAAALRAGVDAQRQGRSRLAADLRRLDVASGRLELIERLTVLLPDSVWISELQANGESLRVRLETHSYRAKRRVSSRMEAA